MLVAYYPKSNLGHHTKLPLSRKPIKRVGREVNKVLNYLGTA